MGNTLLPHDIRLKEGLMSAENVITREIPTTIVDFTIIIAQYFTYIRGGVVQVRLMYLRPKVKR